MVRICGVATLSELTKTDFLPFFPAHYLSKYLSNLSPTAEPVKSRVPEVIPQQKVTHTPTKSNTF